VHGVLAPPTPLLSAAEPSQRRYESEWAGGQGVVEVEDNWLRAIKWPDALLHSRSMAGVGTGHWFFLSSAKRTERAVVHMRGRTCLLPRPTAEAGGGRRNDYGSFPVCRGWLGVRAGRVIGYYGSSTVLVLDWSLAYRAATVWTCYHFPVFRTPATTSSRGAHRVTVAGWGLRTVDADKVAMHHPAIADALMAGRLGQDTRKCGRECPLGIWSRRSLGPRGMKGRKVPLRAVPPVPLDLQKRTLRFYCGGVGSLLVHCGSQPVCTRAHRSTPVRRDGYVCVRSEMVKEPSSWPACGSAERVTSGGAKSVQRRDASVRLELIGFSSTLLPLPQAAPARALLQRRGLILGFLSFITLAFSFPAAISRAPHAEQTKQFGLSSSAQFSRLGFWVPL
jgi:hypothetical protein